VGGLSSSRFIDLPYVYTMHHPHVAGLSSFFSYFPRVQYVTISDFQRAQERMPHMRTIHHGIDLSQYTTTEHKQQYLSFIGRIAPVKGTHIAIEVAKRAGIPLKIAGEVQPMFQDYFDEQIKPHIDGKLVEYVGPADLDAKNELLGNSMAMLFPIQWDEPFGLVMIEAMACGTPVLAFRRGSTPEVVAEGISGHLCDSSEDMARSATKLNLPAAQVRAYAEKFFSVERMVDDYIRLYRDVLGEGQGTNCDASAGEEPAVA
jgi:glycosyltransferase involved in cell wall biosynthesis